MTVSREKHVRVLLLAEQGEAKEAYRAALAVAGAEHDAVEDLPSLRARLRENAYHGLLVDVPTLIKAPAGEKRLVHEVLESYPVLRLRHDPHDGRIHGLYYGQPAQSGNIVADFVHLEAAVFSPRILRVQPRGDLVFNVLVSRAETFAEDQAERSVTVNVSQGGCFLCSFAEFADRQRLWLRIREFADQTPIAAQVRWRVAWGAGMEAPGVGVSFTEMTESQRQELDGWLTGDRVSKSLTYSIERAP